MSIRARVKLQTDRARGFRNDRFIRRQRTAIQVIAASACDVQLSDDVLTYASRYEDAQGIPHTRYTTVSAPTYHMKDPPVSKLDVTPLKVYMRPGDQFYTIMNR